MPIISLTTDFGLRDNYVASVKGYLYKNCKDVIIVDISHDVPKFDTAGAAYLLKGIYKEFPKGSIHIIGVNTNYASGTKFLIVYFDGHYFIGADNGIFSLIIDGKADKIIEIPLPEQHSVFQVKEILAPVACRIFHGEDMNSFGPELNGFIKKMELSSFIENENIIRGFILHFDGYGNAITNIMKKDFDKMAQGRNALVQFGASEVRIGKDYDDVPDGEVLTLFNSSGNLEIALNSGSAKMLFKLDLRQPVRILFE
jgi:S-adenosyl-L-methionine hydrolase (adenosine-forming)